MNLMSYSGINPILELMQHENGLAENLHREYSIMKTDTFDWSFGQNLGCDGNIWLLHEGYNCLTTLLLN